MSDSKAAFASFLASCHAALINPSFSNLLVAFLYSSLSTRSLKFLSKNKPVFFLKNLISSDFKGIETVLPKTSYVKGILFLIGVTLGKTLLSSSSSSSFSY